MGAVLSVLYIVVIVVFMGVVLSVGGRKPASEEDPSASRRKTRR